MSLVTVKAQRDWTALVVLLSCFVVLLTCLAGVAGAAAAVQPWLARSNLPVVEACLGFKLPALGQQELGAWYADRSYVIESPALTASRWAVCGLVPVFGSVDSEGDFPFLVIPH
jgi:hypothetical protein